VPETPLYKFLSLIFEVESKPHPDPYEGYPNGFIFLGIFAIVILVVGVLGRFGFF
jgi:hypothetical protein